MSQSAGMSQGERGLLVRVHGRVQGVGYRAFVRSEAARLNITGWVLNRGDGTVEAALHGDGTSLASLVGRLREGPPAAQVDDLDVRSTDRGNIADVPDGAHAF